VYVPYTSRFDLYFALPAGLSSRYKHGLIHCTPCTAGLVQALLAVPKGILRVLELDTDHLIAGCTVTALDANHSPGSCMFVIKTPATGEVGAWPPWIVAALWFIHCEAGAFIQTSMLDPRSALHQAAGKTIVHTGDFYWLPEMAMHKALRGKQIDALYLDTTILDLAQEPPSQVRDDSSGWLKFVFTTFGQACMRRCARGFHLRYELCNSAGSVPGHTAQPGQPLSSKHAVRAGVVQHRQRTAGFGSGGGTAVPDLLHRCKAPAGGAAFGAACCVTIVLHANGCWITVLIRSRSQTCRHSGTSS
jgi:hypothetical protein